MHLMIIEDNISLREETQAFLISQGYTVTCLTDFREIEKQVETIQPDLLLLDLGLPGVDGQVVMKRIRQTSQLPIIVVTSRNNEMDELISLQLADDFIAKPFHPQILLARIESVLRRSGRSPSEEQMLYGELRLLLSKSQLHYQGQTLDLTVNELRILSLLFKNGEHITSRDDLMNALWQSGDFVDDNTLSVNVNRLRHKLSAISLDDLIHTKRGLGYHL